LNLLLIVQKIWRYKLATLPILAFVAIGSFYVIAIKAPVYEASSTYTLLNPPPPPTPDQIAANPKLGRINSNNPYTRFSDQSVVVQVLSTRLSSDEARTAVAKQGANPDYTVAPSVELGYTAPILQVTGTGASPQEAITTANLVGEAAIRELRSEQAQVAPEFRINMQPVVLAHDAQLKASGQLRALVGVFAIGAILLFVVVSVADALAALRRDRDPDRTDGVGGENAVDAAPLEPAPSGDPDHDERVLASGPAAGRSAESGTGAGVESSGDSATHPRLVIPPAIGDWTDRERDGTARRRRPLRSPRASGR
jgi:hypothetical protein